MVQCARIQSGRKNIFELAKLEKDPRKNMDVGALAGYCLPYHTLTGPLVRRQIISGQKR